MKLTKTQKAEATALDKLRGEHSYLLYDNLRGDERWTAITKLSTGTPLSTRPAVAVRLVVPQESALGQMIVAARKVQERKAKARVRARKVKP